MTEEMTEELLKKLHTAMLNDNEHQCNRLNNYIHTDEYLTADVVKVVREIVTEVTKELREENILLKTKLDALSDGVDWKGILEKNEQIKELNKINTETLSELNHINGDLIIENEKLKAQIEKMRMCENCGWFYLQQHWRESEEIDESRMFHCGTCGNKRNWKLKE